jgi:hypothetical protein
VSRKPDFRLRIKLRKTGPWYIATGPDAQQLSKLLHLAVGRLESGTEFCGFKITEQEHFRALAEDKHVVLVCS